VYAEYSCPFFITAIFTTAPNRLQVLHSGNIASFPHFRVFLQKLEFVRLWLNEVVFFFSTIRMNHTQAFLQAWNLFTFFSHRHWCIALKKAKLNS